jgi:protein TonB
MFGDTLLESSSTVRNNKRWPMATAFTVEALIAAVIVIIPLLSTGVIPLVARVPISLPLQPVTVRAPAPKIDRPHTYSPSRPGTPAPRSDAVVLISNNPNAIHWGERNAATTTDSTQARPYSPGPGNNLIPGNLVRSFGPPDVKLAAPKRIVSQLTEAQLVNRVEPVYPRIATLSGVQGQVKLQAIIARDGSVQSLNVISGYPLLVSSALEAVRQWRYRPYILNGEPVEVETFITVNFRKETH